MSKLFKNTWFRCIAVLLTLSIVLGGTLAVLNDVLYVSPSERTLRAVKKIYGQTVEYQTILDVDDAERTDTSLVFVNENGDEIGSINKVYKVDSDTLFQVTGYNGYKGGTITVWVKVIENSSGHKLIDKIVLESYTKQTLMSKLSSAFYSGFYIDITESYQNGDFFTANSKEDGIKNPITGATKSANAVVGAVNCVVKYVGGEV